MQQRRPAASGSISRGDLPRANARPRPYHQRRKCGLNGRGVMSDLARGARTRSGGRPSRYSLVGVGVLLAVVAGIGAGASNASSANNRTALSSASSAGQIFQGSAQAVFKHLLYSQLQPSPRWPSRLPRRSIHGKWDVYGIGGARLSPCCADPLTSGPTAYFVEYSYRYRRGARGVASGGFGRTSARSFYSQVQFSRHNCAPPRHVRFGGRNVIYFCYPSTNWWGFVGPGGAYLFMSHVYDHVPMSVISRMIASLRPITQLSPPS